MANYNNGYDTHFDYPEFKLTSEQKDVLKFYYGYDFSYHNMNYVCEFFDFADKLNEVAMPPFNLVFEAYDEDSDCWSIGYEDSKWVVYRSIYGETSIINRTP